MKKSVYKRNKHYQREDNKQKKLDHGEIMIDLLMKRLNK